MPDIDELKQILAGSDVFGGLPTEALEEVARSLRPVSYTAGQTIFTRGETSKDMLVIVSGRVKVSILSAEGRELAFSHIGRGGILGEIAMLDGGPRSADATALEAVEAMSLTFGAAKELMRQTPELAMCFIRLLCGRLRAADQQLEGVALHRIEVRLARYLMMLCRQTHPDVEEGEVNIALNTSQGELAILLGASRPKVNGALSLLQDQGAITRQGDAVTCVIEDLRDIAEIE